ncbi:hypothetical protein F2P81_019653 [Scophthalmus maximus]|uniref:C2H2-type domain-containing protein n=1 Tax=Scophthalmus maximus TaxID=52904 RepID=A0A6A4S037_SCOMX|nr:hypothetical protein F2P81_019653 [Scophthalmus maximus]
MNQITVVRIDDSHIAEEQCHDAADVYEVEYSVPAVEEEEDGVYVIEYSNPEEEGESYQFTMSVDRSLPAKKAVRENARAPSTAASKASAASRPRREATKKKKRKMKTAAGGPVTNKSVLQRGDSGEGRLACALCPPPGRLFRRASGLAVHLRTMHVTEEKKKSFFCPHCKQTLRNQIELDTHTRRHAKQLAVYTCLLCPAAAGSGTETATATTTGYKGTKMGLRAHLLKQHPGVVPRCDVCNRGFNTITSYLKDQFRHVGVSPYYCAECQIYEMTERGLNVHIINDDKRKKRRLQTPPPQTENNNPPMLGVSASVDNSATDDSDA